MRVQLKILWAGKERQKEIALSQQKMFSSKDLEVYVARANSALELKFGKTHLTSTHQIGPISLTESVSISFS